MDEGSDSRIQGSKRMLSTEDPDYTRPPDPKRMKEMEQRAQDELRERVVKVVDGVLSNAANEKQNELEEVDARILRIQQCLHTLRYCVSLNYHTANKFGSDLATKRRSYEVHPMARKHMGKAPVSSPELLLSSGIDEHVQDSDVGNNLLTSDRDHQPYCKRLESRDTNCRKANHSVAGEESSNLSTSEILSRSVCQGVSNLTSPRKSVNTDENPDLESLFGPPSPKYLPPKPPDSQTIAQGRHQKYQTKRRVVVGNTYQYLTPQVGRDSEDAMRYKWQIYVRVPTQENDIASFVSDVTFILDRSYAPHHIITLKHPPFVLSRRGWGEFKVQIVLKFTDSRNKQVQLLHPLVLSRPDDPLALTGLWRLGQENWYDVWVYEGCSSEPQDLKSVESLVEEEEMPASLERELQSGTVTCEINQNVTVSHGDKSNKVLPVETDSKLLESTKRDVAGNQEKFQNDDNSTVEVSRPNTLIKVTVSEKISSSKRDPPNEVNNIVNNVVGVSNCKSILQTLSVNNSSPMKLKTVHTVNNSFVKSKTVGADSDVVTVKEESSSISKLLISNSIPSKMCKIHVRQPDGRLLPYFIPAHMYSLALKIAQLRSNTSNTNNRSKSESENVLAVGSDTQNPLCQTEVTVNQVLGDSDADTKVLSLSVADEKGTDKLEENLKVISAGENLKLVDAEESLKLVETGENLKVAGSEKLLVKKKNIAIRKELKSSPSGMVAEIKIPIKTSDGNLMRNPHGIPVKILNLSPSKNPVRVSPVISVNASTSGAQKTVVGGAQGKQTLGKSGALSQSALLQLLSKVGVKDRNMVMQQLLSKTGLKDSTTNMVSLQKVQGQMISAQANQSTSKCNIHLMPVKILQDKQKARSQEKQMLGASSGRIVQQPIRPTNVKFMTNNGQLINAGNLTKGMINTPVKSGAARGMINTSVKSGAVIKPITVNNSLLTVTAAGKKGSSNLKERSNIFMMPDGRILTGSSAGLQVLSSQGKSIVSQGNSLVITNTGEKGNFIQMPKLVGSLNSSGSSSVGVLQAVGSASPTNITVATSASKNTSLTDVTVLASGDSATLGTQADTKPLLKPRTVSVTSGVTSGKLTSILPFSLKKGIVINSSSEKYSLLNKELDSSSNDQERSAQQIWEERARELLAACKSCGSAEACVSLWIRALPLVSSDSPSDTTQTLFPYRATSFQHFLNWPLGKQRASEFQRGREVKRWLDKCKIQGLDQWSVRRIVGWARRYAHTPVSYRKILSTDNVATEQVHGRYNNVTLTCLSDIEKLTGGTKDQLFICQDVGPGVVDVVNVDNTSERKSKKHPASPLKNPLDVVSWTSPDVVNGCEWVGRRTSELRITLPTEEVVPGFMADAARAIAWQAVLTFMEDLLRSSYSQAWEDSSSSAFALVPPETISFSHVRRALVNTRPEFDLFTNYGSGIIARDLNES